MITSYLVIADFFVPDPLHCMLCSINFVECSSIPDNMFMFLAVHRDLHPIQRNAEPESKIKSETQGVSPDFSV